MIGKLEAAQIARRPLLVMVSGRIVVGGRRGAGINLR
jgi:hypothetical protein